MRFDSHRLHLYIFMSCNKGMEEGESDASDLSDLAADILPCLCSSCLTESDESNKCCQYFSKCKTVCKAANVNCITLLPKFIKMMDTDVLELTLHCYHDVLRTSYSSPPENRYAGSRLVSFCHTRSSLGISALLEI